ncbi:SCO family protein [Acetobacter sacchari]|uniref:SCO family protein n=1 Tax=Acetobacter sacchari TaxID=2661687 RepID=A0ABS3LSD5_9PROT|nr:SCO family protein [Acetobacter sacchari]MBO1358826.1 SCO family protein [Acetobacter sacchari]
MTRSASGRPGQRSADKSSPLTLTRRWPFVAVVAFIAALFLGAAGLRLMLTYRTPNTVGGPYALVDMNGRPVTQDTFHGRQTLIYFGYTHCIDVCPLTLATVTQALDSLGPVGAAITPLFVTVDPERDTPAVVKSYVSTFSPDIVGLTGRGADIDRMLREFHVMANRRTPRSGEKPDAYLMDHSSVLYLMDGSNQLMGVLPVDASAERLAAQLTQLTASRKPG